MFGKLTDMLKARFFEPSTKAAIAVMIALFFPDMTGAEAEVLMLLEGSSQAVAAIFALWAMATPEGNPR